MERRAYLYAGNSKHCIYRRSGNIRAVKFSCVIISCYKISVVPGYPRKFYNGLNFQVRAKEANGEWPRWLAYLR